VLLRRTNKIKNSNPLEDNFMKKVISLVAVALMIVGLTGCMDPQDGTKQRPAESSHIAL
jgi:hypothetical protein